MSFPSLSVCLSVFLSCLLAYLPACLLSFLPSFPPFVPSFLPSLPPFLPPSLPPSFLISFKNCYLMYDFDKNLDTVIGRFQEMSVLITVTVLFIYLFLFSFSGQSLTRVIDFRGLWELITHSSSLGCNLLPSAFNWQTLECCNYQSNKVWWWWSCCSTVKFSSKNKQVGWTKLMLAL